MKLLSQKFMPADSHKESSGPLTGYGFIAGAFSVLVWLFILLAVGLFLFRFSPRPVDGGLLLLSGRFTNDNPRYPSRCWRKASFGGGVPEISGGEFTNSQT